MTKEFAVPPVVFPSGGNPSVVSIQKRRVPSAPFQPSRATNPSIPFMSFDIGSVTTASPSPATLYGGPMGGATTFEAEEPLLNELGIHPDQIRRKTLSILNPVRVNAHPHTDSDLSGPVLYYVAFSLFQLLAGKIQFGVILGWIVVSSMFLYVVFNMLAGRTGNLDLHRCTSIVGYCILPVAVFSAVSLCLPAGGVVSFIMAGFFVLWSTRVCTSLLVQSCPDCEEHGGLIAYACFLIYTLFAMLVIF